MPRRTPELPLTRIEFDRLRAKRQKEDANANGSGKRNAANKRKREGEGGGASAAATRYREYVATGDRRALGDVEGVTLPER